MGGAGVRKKCKKKKPTIAFKIMNSIPKSCHTTKTAMHTIPGGS
jgi:hypothetical protein